MSGYSGQVTDEKQKQKQSRLKLREGRAGPDKRQVTVTSNKV